MASLLTFNWIDSAFANPGAGDTGPLMGAQHCNAQSLITALTSKMYAYGVRFEGFGAGTPTLYRSGNGVTWSRMDQGNVPSELAYNNGNASLSSRSGMIYVTSYPQLTAGDFYIIAPFDAGTGLWGTPDVTTIRQIRPRFIGGPSVHFFAPRADGTALLARSERNSSNYDVIKIAKRSAGGTWSDLTRIGTDGVDEFTYLAGGCIDSAGNLHLYFFTYDAPATSNANLYHVSISTGDAVSATHLIDSNVEDFSHSVEGNASQASVAPDGTLAFLYAFQPHTQFDLTAFGDMKVAIGDVSGDPLNPSWTAETVKSGNAPFPVAGTARKIAVAWKGSQLYAHWTSSYPVLGDPNTPGNPMKMWRAIRNASGVWGATEMVVDPSDADYPGDTIWLVENLDGFTSGVGVLFQPSSSPDPSNPGTYLGYSGPGFGACRYRAIQ